jgi:hypothetical protein
MPIFHANVNGGLRQKTPDPLPKPMRNSCYWGLDGWIPPARDDVLNIIF